MLSLQFFGQNGHFSLNLLVALVTFAMFWLYFDAWLVRRERKELLKWLGFLLLAASFIIHSTVIEQSVLGSSPLGSVTQTVALLVRLAGYLVAGIGLAVDPLQAVPKTTGITEPSVNDTPPTSPEPTQAQPTPKKSKKTKIAAGFIAGAALNISLLQVLLPFASLAIAGLYWRRATTGLERHLKPIALAFLVLSISESLGLFAFLRENSNPVLQNLTAAFGTIWFVEHLALLVAALAMARWVWRYLLTRLQIQLVMIFTTATILIFMVTTVSFTYLIMRNIERETLYNLETAGRVLQYALDNKKAETLALAETLAENPEITAAINEGNHDRLIAATSTFLESKKQSTLVVTDADGQVLLRGEDPQRWGDSISSDPLYARTTIGQAGSSVASSDAVLAPQLAIASATPVRDHSGTIVGTIHVGVAIDNAFVDAIKQATGLDVAIYSNNVRSATTFVSADGKTRLVGILEDNPLVTQTVLQQGKTFTGRLALLNTPYLAAYSPLKDVDNTLVGMLFVGKPQVALFASAARSIELTFLVAAVLLVVALLPVRLVANYITYQVE